ncbi:class I SAM-dependent methyltransferase [Bacillus wiedmannii]|uniref:Class I SAM-dependent methyltransferase n=1 Tax=Bacillus wiedmannii TaxID=1890302 RepID=A0A2C4Q1J1_9BACI|nr:class I SAM-dependent methyltransferase [Bacillus wiedmannii]KPU52677.1 methyltransferase small domain protein [Bacillus wiedmannii]PHD58411.1 class I SAM-dependent methyltransferase [Bacillus wiedmannii]PRT05104.1 class I SAM-dependent methyltransferase [Bacillus wiedmannii]PRT32747.1 class I SAM-dependent methyltransferase [Bacillus wiedmannii]PRT39547.1 class I SAM-dependent methyltransferase [Bacillus wiedmannii]
MKNETLHKQEDIIKMLDSLLRPAEPFWNEFYANREKDVPFFANVPDENLVSYIETGWVSKGKVLELGCGPGRNAIYLAIEGFDVTAVDLSIEGINWAKDRANEKGIGIGIQFICDSIFNLEAQKEFDFVYDSGCLHHIPPHRRIHYVDLIKNSLKSGGYFGLTCFAAGDLDERNGSEITDWDVYRGWSLQGGLAYSEEKLREIFDEFEVIEIRKMKQIDQPNTMFGESFLWTALFKKK